MHKSVSISSFDGNSDIPSRWHRSLKHVIWINYNVWSPDMSKPTILIDPQPRTMDMIFQPDVQRRLAEIADLVVFDTGPMPKEMLEKNLPRADLLIGQSDLPAE